MPRLLGLTGLFCWLLAMGSPPCLGKAVIQRWERETPEEPKASPEAPSFPTTPSHQNTEPETPPRKRQDAGLTVGCYGANPAVLLKGIYWEQSLSDTFRFRTGLQSGNSPLTSDIREYSSFVRLPLSLSMRWGMFTLGVQYTNTLVATYEHPSYAMSAFEPLLGLELEAGSLVFGLEATTPLLEGMLPPVVALHTGVRF